MKVIRKIIEIDPERCDGCGQCVIACAEGAIEIINGKATLVSEVYCDGLGACLGECPQGALKLVEREAEDFDPEAVEHYLEQKRTVDAPKPAPFHAARQCPSQQMRILQPGPASSQTAASTASPLTHWTLKILIIPPIAPFMQGADLLVAADCTAVAVPNFHEKFLQGRVVMLGCPKFDNIMDDVDRFTKIFAQNSVRRVTVLSMEVPCCSALLGVVRKGMEKAGKEVPLEEVVLGIGGDVLETRTFVPETSPHTSSDQA